jgi:predicted dehydrogenase
MKFMSDAVRVGIIGCGKMAQNHIGRFLAMPESEIVAIAEPIMQGVESARSRYVEMLNVPVFASHKEMLEKVPMDAVCITTPHTMHFTHIKDAFDAGMHILCEKPMVCSVRETKEVISWFESDPKRVDIVSYQCRFEGTYRYMREGVAAGKIGKVQYIRALQCQEWLRMSQGTWRLDPKLSGGGQLNDSASHLMDFLLWITDLSPARVSAFIDNCGAEVDINSTVSIIFDNGALGNIAIVGNAPQTHEEYSVVGDKGSYFYIDDEIYTDDENGKSVKPAHLPTSTTPTHNFIQCILGEEENGSPVKGFLPVMQLAEAIWRSAAQGGLPVDIDKD